MTHPRKIIRQAIVDMLKAAGTVAEDRVWGSFEPPVNVEQVLIEEGPVILVYTRRDRARDEDYAADGNGNVRRRCDLCVELLAAGSHAVDDKIDDMAEAVEPLIDGFEVPGMGATEIRLMETNIESTTRFAQPVAGAFLLYDACYWKAWRQVEEPEWFPNQVSAAIRGDRPEVVANCDECDECPPGGRL
jgi:hypothetical protein